MAIAGLSFLQPFVCVSLGGGGECDGPNEFCWVVPNLQGFHKADGCVYIRDHLTCNFSSLNSVARLETSCETNEHSVAIFISIGLTNFS